MSYARSFKKLSRAKKLALFLAATTIAWVSGVPALFVASAVSVTSLSDTLTSSAPSTATNHVIVWTFSTSITTGQTISAKLSHGNSGGATDEFTLGSLATTTSDITITGSGTLNQVASEALCSGTASEVFVSGINNTAGNRMVTLQVCSGDTIAGQTLTLNFLNSRITNPSTTGSYVVRIAGTQTDNGEARVAIVNQVTMTAQVPTSLTFTVSGVASSTVLASGLQTSTTTSSTGIGFGRLDVGDDEIGAQLLAVSTNARNGYQVTVVQNQNLLSQTGADLDLFIDGAATAVPVAWQAPANTLGSEATYGHYGITTDDTALTAGNEFTGGTLYAGNIGTARQIMYHTLPVNGTGVGVGTTTVAYRIQITALQEAADDYTNTLTYVCTPIF